MQFKPKTAEDIIKEEKEFRERALFPKGEYDFEVISAEDTTSKKGVDQIKLNIKVWNKAGQEQRIFDYLHPAMEHKLYHFAWGTGVGPKYDAGTLCAQDCEGRVGKVRLKIETTDEWGSKNVVQDYIGSRPEKAKEEDDGDAVPF